MQTRPGTYDESMLRDGAKSYRRIGIQEGETVLDIGAHIGGFAVWAAQQGARVVAYEPVAENVALLRENVAGLPVEVRERGVLAKAGTAAIHVTSGPHTGHHSFVIDSPHRTDRVVEVEAFMSVLSSVWPARVKIDIEGAEHLLEYAHLPVCVKGIAIEIELGRPGWRTDASRIHRELAELGFEAVKLPRGNSYSVGIWRRDGGRDATA